MLFYATCKSEQKKVQLNIKLQGFEINNIQKNIKNFEPKYSITFIIHMKFYMRSKTVKNKTKNIQITESSK